ncbi:MULTISPECIES: lysozyme inhibitor LprI family protein [unclassified Mesorhizobium]|uniref:lysozyme inhibitor LprI family protein n=1 Tax=unclassified Mesorhizobium TaxID=325217 RepID=UPI0015E4008C|nr:MULTISPECIES: lysozyme inhibitor LprI family protein [unclassified Mesorhizobium]
MPAGLVAARIAGIAGSWREEKAGGPMISKAGKAGLVAVPLAMLAALLLANGDARALSKPSFDCAKAASTAEKAICADPALAQADADVAKSYAAALKLLDARAGKALRDDQSDFIRYRDQIADFNKDTPKDKQTVDLAEFMHDRATFLADIRKPSVAGFIGTWSSMRGTVEIKAVSAVRLEISEEVAEPISGNGLCEIGGTVKLRNELRLVDTDDDNKPTGFSFTFRHSGDALVVEQSGDGKDGRTQPPSCGANGHADGTFFLTEQRK